ncbi:MAG: DUF2437 domain-containing protein, partial [Actinomycetales bacterium]|nr:DUF2437 domain-containing protein [Actinomycetales bacterium]
MDAQAGRLVRIARFSDGGEPRYGIVDGPEL